MGLNISVKTKLVDLLCSVGRLFHVDLLFISTDLQFKMEKVIKNNERKQLSGMLIRAVAMEKRPLFFRFVHEY